MEREQPLPCHCRTTGFWASVQSIKSIILLFLVQLIQRNFRVILAAVPPWLSFRGNQADHLAAVQGDTLIDSES